MTKYTISNENGIEVIVGWDNLINTYFYQKFVDNELVESVGQTFSEYENFNDFIKKLNSMNIDIAYMKSYYLQVDKFIANQ